MTKSKWNFVIDVIMFLFMGLITGIGFLIKYKLIPGSERWEVYGRNVDLSLFGLDRHEWGEIHLILGFILLGLLILHIILHWKIIKCLYRKFISAKNARIVLASIFTLITMSFVFIPFIIPIEIEEIATGKDRHHVVTELDKSKLVDRIHIAKVIDKNSKTLVPETKGNESVHHHKVDSSIEVKGYMTLQEVSNNYDVPCAYIKSKLNIPEAKTNNIRLGQLKKKYNFKMSDLELIISNYKKEHR